MHAPGMARNVQRARQCERKAQLRRFVAWFFFLAGWLLVWQLVVIFAGTL